MALVLIALGLEGACAEPSPRLAAFVPETPRERYEHAFRQVGLHGTALGERWIRAGESALHSALELELPFREVGYFDPNDAGSLAFRVGLERGERFLVELDFGRSQPLVFIDLFRVVGDSLRPLRSMAHADSAETRLEYVVRRSGEYVFRVQPELLASGRYDLTVAKTSSLQFPVSGHGAEAIQSGFGDPRDGGSREHHGVDIFAPRGTPVVAAGPGRVRSTRGNPLGGRVVWLRTDNGESLYYAHLDSVAVRRGMTVRAGDTVGFVGNSGNAQTTPPHLHFGIYARGPTDPEPFINPRPVSADVVADTAVVGDFVRVARSRIAFNGLPSGGDEAGAELERGTLMRVLGSSADSYRVVLPNRAVGFVARSTVEPTALPVAERVLTRATALHQSPTEPGAVVDSVSAGSTLQVLGRFNSHVFVQTDDNKVGWIAAAFDGPRVTLGESVASPSMIPRPRRRAQQ